LKLLANLESWNKLRNFSVHQIVKIHEGKDLTWEERIEAINKIAILGKVLVADTTNWSRRKLKNN
jgi:hypothetical protein